MFSRRRFFGAAAAAPVVGKSIVTDAVRGTLPPPITYDVGSRFLTEPRPDVDSGWYDVYSRQARGEYNDDEVAEWKLQCRYRALAMSNQIDVLRSVSPAVKFLMMSDRELERQKEKNRIGAIRQLIAAGKWFVGAK